MARSGTRDARLAALQRRWRSLQPLLAAWLGLVLVGCQRPSLAPAPQALRTTFALTLAASAPGDDEPMRALLAEVERLLPPKLKQRIGRPIVIAVDPNKVREPISVPACDAPPSSPRAAALVPHVREDETGDAGADPRAER